MGVIPTQAIKGEWVTSGEKNVRARLGDPINGKLK